jgi:hypothetical protein
MAATSQTKDGSKMSAIGVQDEPIPNDTINKGETIEVDDAYLSSSWFPKFFRGVLCQMILFGA